MTAQQTNQGTHVPRSQAKLFAVTLVLVAGLLGSPVVWGQNKTPVAKDPPASQKEFPPGWFPRTMLDDATTWQDVRNQDEKDPKIRLYFPPGVKTVRGVFFCFQFHSADPRHAAKAWDFALVTVPWAMEYDIGVNDKRSGRFKLGHSSGNMGYLLMYLEIAAKETNHPELTTAPIVGWLMQNGARFAKDLHERAPERVLAWSEGWPNQLKTIPETLAKMPYAYAWELGNDVKERKELAAKLGESLKDKHTPPRDFSCRASAYGFKHGVYSKYGFFVAYLDRCIRINPKATPWTLESGWVGDFNPMTEWAPIAPYKEAKGMIQPVWLPDEYAAWMWRAYHSAKPDLKIKSPVTEYHGGDRSDCGSGYSKPTPANTPVKIVAEVKSSYAKVEFYDGNRLLGSADKSPYEIDGIRFERGIHALIAIGVTADGRKVSSHPAFLGVE